MAYGVDRYPNPPQYSERVVYYEREDCVLVRRVERDATEPSAMLANAACSILVKHQRELTDARAAKKNKGRDI